MSWTIIQHGCRPASFKSRQSGRSHSPRRTSWLHSLIILIVLTCGTTLAFSMNEPDPKRRKQHATTTTATAVSSAATSDNEGERPSSPEVFVANGEQHPLQVAVAGRLEELKQQEASLSAQLAAVRREKLQALHSRPLTIGLVGYGRFGQFIAKAFTKHGHVVVVTSRSDYSSEAAALGVTYVPLDQPQQFFAKQLDVIVFCVSILSFEETIESMLPHLQQDLLVRGDRGTKGPLVVDVLSVKEHPRQILLDLMPPQVDLLLTHPMFGPDSGKNGWHGLTFVYEKTRIDGVVLDPEAHARRQQSEGVRPRKTNITDAFIDATGTIHSVHEHSEAHVEAVDRMERFLSIWEEEGCHMVPMSCREHDAHAANSQFITHLMGRILGEQGLKPTPIDTSGFKNVLRLVDSTTADSFDLFYGLFKFNQHSANTIVNLQAAMDDVVKRLQSKKQQEDSENKHTSNQQLAATSTVSAKNKQSPTTSSYLASLGQLKEKRKH